MEQRAIVAAFKRGKSITANKAIMKFFACEGIPFNKARSSWYREMISTVAADGPGYASLQRHAVAARSCSGWQLRC